MICERGGHDLFATRQVNEGTHANTGINVVWQGFLGDGSHMMTVTVNRRGQIVLRVNAGKNLAVKSGDVFVVVREQAGRIVLQKRRSARHNGRTGRSYLSPPPLSAATRAGLYTRPNPEGDKVEAEATARSKRSLAGKRLEDL